MKLDDFIKAYNYNRIPAKIKEKTADEKEQAGVIEYGKYIYSSYLLDKESMVTALKLFIQGVITEDKTINNQIGHVIDALVIIQKSIELLGNTTKEEANEILKNLGAFSTKLEEKAVVFLDHIYKISTSEGLLLFDILEKEEEGPQ